MSEHDDNPGMQDAFFDGNPADIFGTVNDEHGDDPVVSDDPIQQEPEKSVQQDAQQPQPTLEPDFEKRFMKEDGTYDVEGAMKFVETGFGSGTYKPTQNYAGAAFFPQTQPQSTQQIATDQQKEPWEIEFEERQKYETELRSQRQKYREYMQEAAAAGSTGQQILDYADAKINEEITKEVEKWNYKRAHERSMSERKKIEEERELSSLSTKSRSNILEVSKSIGGESVFNELVIGKPIESVVGGQKVQGHQPGYGLQIINDLYEEYCEKNPKPQSPNQVAEHFKNWWTRYTARPQNVQRLVDYSLAQLHLKQQKHIVEAARNAGRQSQMVARRTQTAAPSKITKKQAAPSGGLKGLSPGEPDVIG